MTDHCSWVTQRHSSQDTFRLVLSRIETTPFQECFLNWLRSAAKVVDGELIMIDSKTMKRSHDFKSGKAAIHMVSAWTAETRLAFGQIKTEEISYKVTAIPELRKLLEIKGSIVTTDAMVCQRKIASQVIQKSSDYVLGERVSILFSWDRGKSLHWSRRGNAQQWFVLLSQNVK